MGLLELSLEERGREINAGGFEELSLRERGGDSGEKTDKNLLPLLELLGNHPSK